MSEDILKVLSVETQTLKTMPPQLVVTAQGEVGTPGWTSPELTQVEYVVRPTDGIQDFSFVAEPPSGTVTQTVTAIEARNTFEKLDWWKGVRIKAAQNSIEAKL